MQRVVGMNKVSPNLVLWDFCIYMSNVLTLHLFVNTPYKTHGNMD